MRCLILAAGRFDDELRANIARHREPRLDVFELARELNAKVIDFQDVDRSRDPRVMLTARTAGKSAAVALLGFLERSNHDAFFTTGEDIGLPLALLMRARRVRASHTMIAHTLFPQKKQLFFKLGRVAGAIDRTLVYSTSEERLAIDVLGLPANSVERIAYHADQEFFRPDGRPTEPNSICAAGQLLRDYDCLVDAVRDGEPDWPDDLRWLLDTFLMSQQGAWEEYETPRFFLLQNGSVTASTAGNNGWREFMWPTILDVTNTKP